MFNNPTFTLADQVIGIVAVFCRTMAAEACRMGSLSVVVWTRVRRLERRFLALHAAWKAGRAPAVRVVRAGAVAPPPPRSSAIEGEGKEAATRRPASLLPRALRWMPRTLPRSAGTLGGMFGALVENHPEMRRFVAEVPQVGRVLRPLLRLAGLHPPAWLRLPRRDGVRRAYVASPPSGGGEEGTSPRPSPHSGEGEEKRRRRTPREMATAAQEKARRTGKPVDWKRLGSMAAGYLLHPPRDEHCPPPEIGYAPMRVRVPKDYRPPPEDEK